MSIRERITQLERKRQTNRRELARLQRRPLGNHPAATLNAIERRQAADMRMLRDLAQLEDQLPGGAAV